MKTSHLKRKNHALIAMATGALSLGSACIQSEWDLCRDSSGLHLFNLPHRKSFHTEKAGTKRGETPSPQPGMTSNIWGYRVGLLGISTQELQGTLQKQKWGGSAWPWPILVKIIWNRICYWKPQSLNTWQVSHGSGAGLSLISQNGFRLSLFMSFLKTYG